MKIFSAACVTALFSCTSLHAVSVSLSASKDNTIYSENLSNGAGQHIFAGVNGGGGGNQILRGLIAFDIASFIPAGATIDSATLSLFDTTPRDFGSHAVSIHRLLSDWGEAASLAGMGEGGGATPLPGDASWLSNFTGTSTWTTPGGDFVATPSATTNVLDPGFDYTWSSAQVNADVQSWLDNPSANFGWILRGEETTSNIAKRFSSRTGPENLSLEIEYTPIPEPSLPLFATLSLFPLALRRRR